MKSPWIGEDEDNDYDSNGVRIDQFMRSLQSTRRPKAQNPAMEIPIPPSLDDMTEFTTILMDELERQGTADFVLLKNDKLREWWAGVKADRRVIAEQKRLAALRQDLISRMTDDEKKALGFA